ncbi:(2Fe-2S)-binding protein [Devosia pacifica]|uniref:(2Fe-2S)-binding protein n=1 Tax=Devosia pacifica TaxID=1335967 RepID=A0A918SFF7_9HYPH|nr:aromatic ring-hydroxylating dioxygenase subunit alpha [Devosia pacifica]GHA35982.1 (2Fe-2S)-binding protein [Devosia pacifica]
MNRPNPYLNDHWHVVAGNEAVASGQPFRTVLFDVPIIIQRLADGLRVTAALAPEKPLPVLERYGFIWTSLGTPMPLFEIPEYDEADRRNMNAGSLGVAVSAPRAIENFLDMGHFPYVHTDILGAEPHTEVKEYDVEVSAERGEVLATRCRFFQPRAATSSAGGQEVEYVYRVPHPYCSVLYKSCPSDENRRDVIAIFCQPVGEERIVAHMLQSLIDDVSTITDMRRFQQTIFGQDKPILENQYPKKLPLDPRAETPIRADKSAIAYRRWLSQMGVNYGVIPLVPRVADV